MSKVCSKSIGEKSHNYQRRCLETETDSGSKAVGKLPIEAKLCCFDTEKDNSCSKCTNRLWLQSSDRYMRMLLLHQNEKRRLFLFVKFHLFKCGLAKASANMKEAYLYLHKFVPISMAG